MFDEVSSDFSCFCQMMMYILVSVSHRNTPWEMGFCEQGLLDTRQHTHSRPCIHPRTHKTKSPLKISSYNQPLLTYARISHEHTHKHANAQWLQQRANLLSLSIKGGRWSNSWCHSVVLRLVQCADRWDSFTRRREEEGDEKKKRERDEQSQ